jgi:hypothetical protein
VVIFHILFLRAFSEHTVSARGMFYLKRHRQHYQKHRADKEILSTITARSARACLIQNNGAQHQGGGEFLEMPVRAMSGMPVAVRDKAMAGEVKAGRVVIVMIVVVMPVTVRMMVMPLLVVIMPIAVVMPLSVRSVAPVFMPPIQATIAIVPIMVIPVTVVAAAIMSMARIPVRMTLVAVMALRMAAARLFMAVAMVMRALPLPFSRIRGGGNGQ